MSRQRFIHPAIWTSEGFMALSRDAQLLFIGLFSTADDYGRGRGSPTSIKGTLWPGKAIEDAQVVAWVGEIIDQGMVLFYQVKGRVLYFLPSWDTWQKPKYKAPSKYPEYNAMPEPARNPPRSGPSSVVGCGVEWSRVEDLKPAPATPAAAVSGHQARKAKDTDEANRNRRRVAKKTRCEAEAGVRRERRIGGTGRPVLISPTRSSVQSLQPTGGRTGTQPEPYEPTRPEAASGPRTRTGQTLQRRSRAPEDTRNLHHNQDHKPDGKVEGERRCSHFVSTAGLAAQLRQQLKTRDDRRPTSARAGEQQPGNEPQGTERSAHSAGSTDAGRPSREHRPGQKHGHETTDPSRTEPPPDRHERRDTPPAGGTAGLGVELGKDDR